MITRSPIDTRDYDLKFCNSSCGFEDYIYFGMVRFKEFYVYFHKTPVYVKDKLIEEADTMMYSQQLFDGNYILKE